MRKYILTILLILMSLLLLVACRPTEPIYPIEPHVLILSPAMNSTFPPGPVTVKVWVESFDLVDKVGQPNVPGEGHLIYYLDALPPVQTATPAITDTGTYVVSTDTIYTWPNIAAGEHTLAVQAVNNDNSPINAPTAVRVHITVK